MDIYNLLLIYWLIPLESVALLLAIRFLWKVSPSSPSQILSKISTSHPSEDCRMLAKALLSRL